MPEKTSRKYTSIPSKEEHIITCVGLDPDVPYGLGNKMYEYERNCNSGHKNLDDNEIAFVGGHYDGYSWTVPVCLRCVRADKEYPLASQHSHNTAVHLKKIKTISDKGRGVCEVCGCTDLDCSGCIEKTGIPCHWVTGNLCSACATEDPHA